MQQLDEALISRIGTFLPYNDRLRCLETSKLFKSINNNYKFHKINVCKQPDLVTHLPFLKKIKPLLNDLYINCRDQTLALSAQYQQDIHCMENYVNTMFSDVEITLKFERCSNEFIQTMLSVTKSWRNLNIDVSFNPTEIVFPELLQLLQQRSIIQLCINIAQLPLLDDSNLMKCVSKIHLNIERSDNKLIVVNTEHLLHMTCVQLTTNANVSLTHPENITRCVLYDMVWEEEHPLLQEIKQMRGSVLRVTMMEYTDAVKTCHVRNNFWYKIIMNAPKNSEIYYVVNIKNACIIPMAKKMSLIGGDRFALLYDNDDEFILSKMVQHFVPNVEAWATTSFVKGVYVKEGASLAELYSLMTSDVAKDVWSWLA